MAHTIPFMKKSTTQSPINSLTKLPIKSLVNSLTELPIKLLTQARILSSNLMALLSLVVILVASSCTTYKDLQYLQGEIDSVKYSQFKVPEHCIHKKPHHRAL